jgi:hypothetical protein
LRPVTTTVTGNGSSILNSPPVVIDQYLTPINIGLSFTDSGSTTVFKVQYSCDDPFAVYATDYNTNAQWFDHPSLTGLSAAAFGTITFPVRAVRLQSSAAGTDIGKLEVQQAGLR